MHPPIAMFPTLPLGGAARKGLVATVLFWALTTSAQAQLLAYESFNYTPGSFFATSGGTATTATGFTGNLAWDYGTTSASILQSGSLSYTDGSMALVTSNNFYENGHGRLSSTFDLSGGGPFAAYLESGRIGANGTTIYLSFIYQKTTTSTAGFASGLELFRGGYNDPGRVLSLNTWSGHSVADYHLTVGEGANGGSWAGGAASSTNADLGFVTAAATFFVIRIDFGAGTDTARIYANPLLSSEPGSATGQVSASDLSFDRIASSTFSGAPSGYLDEIRVGTTYLSVAAATAVPEPATAAALLGAAALVLAALRRRVQIT